MKLTTTLATASAIHGLLKLLNGSTQVINGEKVHTPYQFSGGACYQIAKNLNLLRPSIEVYTEAMKLMSQGMLEANTKSASPKSEAELDKEFDAAVKKDLDGKETVIDGLLPISVATLNLDRNAIQPGVVADLIKHGLIVD